MIKIRNPHNVSSKYIKNKVLTKNDIAKIAVFQEKTHNKEDFINIIVTINKENAIVLKKYIFVLAKPSNSNINE